MYFGNFCLYVGLLCLTVGALAKQWEVVNYQNDAHPGKCVVSDTLILSPGEKAKSPNSCSKIACHNNGYATIWSCFELPPPEGCKWGDYVNEGAPFEECCARHLVCDGGFEDWMREYEQLNLNAYKKSKPIF